MTGLVELALFTDDVAATSRFYGDLLGVAPEAEWPGGTVFASGSLKILVHERAAAMEDGPPNEDHVAFAVEDVDHASSVLGGREHTLLVEPRDYPWGRSAYLRDPDGRLVELSHG